MGHKLIRIVIGTIWLIVGVTILVRGNPDWWQGVGFLLVGAAFLYPAFRSDTKK
mgnify:FL=1|jgi:hypothetical protein